MRCSSLDYSCGELEISTPTNSQVTLEEFISQLQNEIILAYNKSQQISLSSFNKISQQLQQAIQIINEKDKEVKRLEELCEKNKIEFKPKVVQNIPQIKK